MIIGTNWVLGFSHCTAAKDDYIKEVVRERSKIADILAVFLRAGVDTIIGQIATPPLREAIDEAQARTGKRMIVVSTPTLPTDKRTALDGFNPDAVAKVLDNEVKFGARFCMPHTCTTDLMVDRCSREIRQMDKVCRMIRERGMIPGLSTHMPEAIVFADETGLDAETYVCIYNAMGFLMPVEVDWVARVIQEAKKPVLTIKPLASGQLRPLQGLTFVWNTLRDKDMVAVGTMSPKEAQECIDLSLAILEKRASNLRLQETRSKEFVKRRTK
jgi:hypothetical protein